MVSSLSKKDSNWRGPLDAHSEAGWAHGRRVQAVMPRRGPAAPPWMPPHHMATRLQGPGGTKVLNSHFYPKGIHGRGLPKCP